jgi:sugar phosphate isomerase/epimerase
MTTPLAGHTNSYHTYTLDEALAGIAEAGYAGVELSAVPGWTEHVVLDDDPAELRAKLAHHGLTPVSLSGHSDLTTKEGLAHGVKAVRWAADYGLPIVNTAIGGHWSEDEDESAFLGNIDELATVAEEAGIVVALEIHGDIMASGAKTKPLVERIGRESIRVNYDTANCEFYGAVTAIEDIPAIAPYLAHVHLKDKVGGPREWDFPAPGEGHVDFAGVLRALADAGYTGPYSVEIEFKGEPWPPLAEVTRAMTSSYRHLSSLGLS